MPVLPETAAETLPTESNPNSLEGWMKDLPTLETETPSTPEKPKEAAGETPTPSPSPSQEAPREKEAEPPKVPEKATETPRTSDEEDKWPRSQSDWAKFKAKKQELKERLEGEIKAREEKLAEAVSKNAKIEQELTQLREKSVTGSPEVQQELERLKKVNQELSTRLAAADIQAHPDFQNQYKALVDEQYDAAREIVGQEKSEAIIKALQLPNGDYKKLQIEEFFNDLSPMQQSELAVVLRDLSKIEKVKAQKIAESQQLRAKLDSEAKTAAEKRIADNKAMFAKAVAEMQDPEKGLPPFQLRKDDAAWNEGVKQRIAVAEKYLFGHEGMDGNTIIKGAMQAATYPLLVSEIQRRDTEIGKLQEQVKALSAAQPRPRGTGGEPDTQPPPLPNRGMSPMEASASFFRNLHRTDE